MSVSYAMKFDGMQGTIASMRSSVRSIEALLADLDREVASLQAGWSGEAMAAYLWAQGQWRASASGLNRILDDAAGAAEGAIDRHLEARSEVARLWT